MDCRISATHGIEMFILSKLILNYNLMFICTRYESTVPVTVSPDVLRKLLVSLYYSTLQQLLTDYCFFCRRHNMRTACPLPTWDDRNPHLQRKTVLLHRVTLCL